MKSTKEPRKKPYRSALSNALWSFRGMLQDTPISFAMAVLEVPLHVFLAWAGVYLPALVVAEVTNHETLAHASGRVGILILLMFLAGALQSFCETLSNVDLQQYRFRRSIDLDRKSMGCFYQVYERKDVRDLYDRAAFATQMWNGAQPISDMPRRSLKLVENLICYCLFGSVISFVSPWLLPFLTAAPVVNWLCQRAYRQWEYSHRDKWADIDRKLWYVTEKPADFAASKDIRIYGMAGWFRQVYGELSAQRGKWDRKLAVRSFLSRIADLVVILLRDGAAYAMLIGMTLRDEITVDQFVLYFAAISTFAAYVGNIMTEWNGMHDASLKVCDFREYMDLPEHDGTGEAKAEDHVSTPPEITFDHVCFRYEGAEQDALHNVSFTIRSGEKIALVGLNGAGKTTLVKLLCGLYLPTQGDIRIDGVSIGKFKRSDYYRLFSPVFQDAQTGFFSLAETVSGQIGEGADPDRVRQCIRLAGLEEKVNSLPQGIQTPLDKQVNKGGIELSGGELQKLMLARALYKNAPILVLDEPTAALDPIAENQIYLQYRAMTESKTSLFISHRLASTQFCDRILYLQDGKILEEGTHSELIALGGEYSKLYELQSCWYRDDYQGGEQE